jgi:hypothetical protein
MELLCDWVDIIFFLNNRVFPDEEHKYRISQGLKESHKKVVFERRSQGHLKYYRNNDVWNKGRPWPLEIREKIRQGCLNRRLAWVCVILGRIR